jgi:glutamine synthetase
MTALTAASVPSYLRLKPHNWSASYTSLAERDREASLRICPTVSIGGRDPARQFNLEYRAADATANPYLALAAIVRAGLEGIRSDLPTPPITTGDPSLMSQAELSAGGLVRLPQSLGEALDVLLTDRTVTGWFSPAFVDSFVGVKRAEIARLDGMSPTEICALYGALF